MSMIKRVSGILTPPPFRKREKPPESQSIYTDHEQDFNRELRALLTTLISAESSESEEAAKAIADIKRLARSKGPYIAAARIRIQLESLQGRQEKGARSREDRGYRLAADFIIQQIVKEIDGIQATGAGMGPNILSNYCTDLVSCLIDAEEVRRAVEVPVMLTDRLLGYAVGATDKRQSFLALVQTPSRSAKDLVRQEVQQQLRKQRQKALLRDKSKGEDAALPERDWKPDWDLTQIENGLNYIEQFAEQSRLVAEAFGRYERMPTVPREQYGGALDAARASQHLEYLRGLQEVATGAGYVGFLAAVQEEAAPLMLRANRERGLAVCRSAGQSYETQGDRERTLGLIGLAPRRYQKAYQLYTQAQDQARAEAVKAKLGS